MGKDNNLVAYAEALYDFPGVREDNLPFSKGDVIMVTDMDESGWWKGSNGEGRVGIFPYNYVQLRDEVGDAFPIFRGVYAFEAMSTDQLSFAVGEELVLVKEMNQDWYITRNARGHEGLVPANRLERTGKSDTKMAEAEKKRWSMMKKEKAQEAAAAQKKRESAERKVRKEKDEQERARLAKERRDFEERARKAEEELERVRAEAELLKQQQIATREAATNKRTSVNKQKLRIANKARVSVRRFNGQSPGPPPPMRKTVVEEEDDDDDFFGKEAPQVAPPPERKRLAGSAAESEAGAQQPEPEKDDDAGRSGGGSAAPAKKTFVYNNKFANLGGGTKCKLCNKSVGFADKVKALNAEWHKDCFRCSTCSVVLRQGEWRENNLNPYCVQCHAAGFGPKGFGFGGVVAMAAETGRTGGASASATLDERPIFEQGLDSK